MNPTPFSYLDQMPRSLDVSQLEKFGGPMHQMLSELIQHCSPHPATRTATASSLMLSLWQMRAESLSRQTPSLILLNAGESIRDPIDDFISSFTQEGTGQAPQETTDRYGVPIDPKKAPDIMKSSAERRRKLGLAPIRCWLDQKNAKAFEGRYHDAKRVAFGTGLARPYSKSWSEDFGFVTDENDVLIARLNDASDRAAFRRDVIDTPDRLRNPIGIGGDLQTVRKMVSVSGSLTVDLWDEAFVMGIIKLGLPILFIPHTAKETLTISDSRSLDAYRTLWHIGAVSRAHPSLTLPPIDWFETHSEDMRRRLHLLPFPDAYEFAVHQVIHQLSNVCDQIAKHAGRNHEANPAHIASLFWDLHARALRGITLGVAALAWHCLGFDPGCPREKAVKVLRDLRAKGSMNRSEIRRNHHLDSKEQRDLLLERFAGEGLVRIDGRTVTAASFEEFVTDLYSRPELPEAADGREAADGKKSA